MGSPLKLRHISSFQQPTLDFDSKVSTDGSNMKKSEASQHGTDHDSDMDILSNIDLKEAETGMIHDLDEDQDSDLSSLHLSDEDSGMDLPRNPPQKSTRELKKPILDFTKDRKIAFAKTTNPKRLVLPKQS